MSRWRCGAPDKGQSFFCFFFLQKKEDSSCLFYSGREEDGLLRCARNDGLAL